MVRDIGPLTLSCGLDASVTVIVGVAVTAVVGVPVIAQLFAVNANPAGRVPPVTVQTYGPVPPVTPTDPVYGAPTMPFGGFDTVSPPVPEETIVRLIGPSAVSCGFEASVTWIVMFDVPTVVGVPVTVQLFGVIVNPAGSVPTVTVQTYGVVPPATGIVAE